MHTLLWYAIYAQMLHVTDDAGLVKHQMLPLSRWTWAVIFAMLLMNL